MPEMTLDKNSSMNEIRNWISNAIRTLRREGKTGDEAAGQAYGMARKATGKRLGR